MKTPAPADFDDYCGRLPDATQESLRVMRGLIKTAAPEAQETISYGIPAFALNRKAIVWFAAFKSHIGLYPGAAAIAAFKDDLAPYKAAKGSVQFPLDRPLPASLVDRLVRFSVRRFHEATARR